MGEVRPGLWSVSADRLPSCPEAMPMPRPASRSREGLLILMGVELDSLPPLAFSLLTALIVAMCACDATDCTHKNYVQYCWQEAFASAYLA
jgi:hypothetical protein